MCLALEEAGWVDQEGKEREWVEWDTEVKWQSEVDQYTSELISVFLTIIHSTIHTHSWLCDSPRTPMIFTRAHDPKFEDLLSKKGQRILRDGAQSFSHNSVSRAWLFATPWTVHARLLCPWEFSRQEYWNGLPCSTPGILSDYQMPVTIPHWVGGASMVAQPVKNLPAIWKTRVWALGWEDPLEKGKATHSRILVWRIPWTV